MKVIQMETVSWNLKNSVDTDTEYYFEEKEEYIDIPAKVETKRNKTLRKPKRKEKNFIAL